MRETKSVVAEEGSIVDELDLREALSPARRGWVDRAACQDVDPELFFPVGTTGPAVRQVGAAQAVCARCPVTDECLDWALSTGQDHGVWAGTTPEERRALRRARSDQRHGSDAY